MAEINYTKVAVAGLVAGLVVNAGEYVLNEVVLAEAQTEAFDAMGLAVPGGREIAIFIAMTFVMTFTMMWLYAALRASLGAGPKTAVCTGVVFWVPAVLGCGTTFAVLGMAPVSMTVIAVVWGLVELPLGAVAGAYFYSD